MKFNEGLQVRLQERYRRLYKSDVDSYDAQTRYFLTWADAQPALRSIMQAIERAEPDLEVTKWLEENEGDHIRTKWPVREIGSVKLTLGLLRQIACGEHEGYQIAWSLVGTRNAEDALRDFTSKVVEPLIEYLQERLAAETDVLYVLERYRRRVAWFEQGRLWSAYQADTKRGEAIYDNDLRRFLFEQGVDYPFSQPASPSGQADVVADLHSEQPLVCEVKLFDGARYGATYIAKGLHQAIRYAEDYGKTEAYLVIFNLTEQPLQLPSDQPEFGWPERLAVAGATVFLIAVQAAPRPKASTSGTVKPHVLTRAQLVANV
jgi:hypothetical protein